MGMAASQARLLSITARIHDVEYQAQSIQNAKVQLATQSDQVYNEYMEALDAQTLTISTIGSDGSTNRLTATFNNLFSANRVNPADGSIYGLVDTATGYLIVEDDIYEAYEKFKGKDPYTFANYMLGNDMERSDISPEIMQAREEYIYNLNKEDIGEDSNLGNLRKSLEEYVQDGSDIYSGKLKDKYNDEEGQKKYQAVLEQYRELLYKQYGQDICTKDLSSVQTPGSALIGGGQIAESHYDQETFNNYVNIFNQIKMCGGCIPISDYNGMFGDASNNSEWLTSMIQCGKFVINTFSKDKNGTMTMNGTSPSSDTCLSYTETTAIDSTAAKKAEAKYEKDLKEIDQKDKQYDLTLSKLETERQALTTEYESVQKVIEDNIDRTFGIFS